jgi:hypothetical protein
VAFLVLGKFSIISSCLKKDENLNSVQKRLKYNFRIISLKCDKPCTCHHICIQFLSHCQIIISQLCSDSILKLITFSSSGVIFIHKFTDDFYSVFQGFSKAKSANHYGGSILRLSQFLILPRLPQKIKLASKVVKVDSKIIISLPKI